MEKNQLVQVPSVENLLEAGVHFGHQSTRWNPKMKKFIFQKKQGIHLIDLVKTHKRLTAAAQFVRDLSLKGKKVLFVGTKKQAVQIIQTYAKKTSMPHITNRWIGGLLTNYGIVSKNIIKLNNLKRDLGNPEFLEKYTKKEVIEFKHQYAELIKVYEGVQDLNRLPEAMFVIDAHHEKTAVWEARRKKIPVIAMLDTNANPDLVDYPIPANDDSFKSIELITKTIAEALGYRENSQA